MIKIIDFMPVSIIELIKNPLAYASEESRRDSAFSVEDLDKDTIFEYEIVLKDLNKINEKISEFNSLGISLATLESRINKNLDDKGLTKNTRLLNLTSGNIIFNDKEATIIIGNKIVELPPFKKEHRFCKSMFQYPVGELVDWSVIYEDMANEESTDKDKDKRKVIDAVYAINRRIRGLFKTKDTLFTREHNTIKRNF